MAPSHCCSNLPENAPTAAVASTTASSWSSLMSGNRVSESSHIPLGNCGLIRVGIATMLIDGTEHGVRLEGIDEGAGSVVYSFTDNTGVIGIHDAVNKANFHPLRDKISLPIDHKI